MSCVQLCILGLKISLVFVNFLLALSFYVVQVLVELVEKPGEEFLAIVLDWIFEHIVFATDSDPEL